MASNSPDDLNESLLRFYRDIAKPEYIQVEPILKLKEKVREVLRQVEEKDPRFRGEQVDVGSFSSGLGAMHNEESDSLLILDVAGKWEQDPRYPECARFKLFRHDDTWADCRSEDGYLHPRRVADLFFVLVKDVISDLPGKHRLTVSGEGTVATTVSGNLSDFGFLGNMPSIDMDLVPAIRCYGWPPSADARWLHHHSEWPSREQVRKIKQNGFQLVAKSYHDERKDCSIETLWRLSLAVAEDELLHDIDPYRTGVILCHKRLLIVLKSIRKLLFAGQRDTTPIFTSFHFKNLFYHEKYNHPNESDWTLDRFGDRFLSAFQRLVDYVRNENMPHFFIPGVNLFKKRGVRDMGFSNILKDPVIFVDELTKASIHRDFTCMTRKNELSERFGGNKKHT